MDWPVEKFRYRGKDYYVREMTAGERIELLAELEEKTPEGKESPPIRDFDYPTATALFTASNPDGQRLYSTVEEVKRAPTVLIHLYFRRGLLFNKIGEEDLAEEKKSYSETPSNVSSADSS